MDINDIAGLRQSLFTVPATELTQWEDKVFNHQANLSTVERERLSALCHYILHKLCDLAAKQSANTVQYENSSTLRHDISKVLALSPYFVGRLIQAGQRLLKSTSTPKPVKQYHFFRALARFIGALGFSAFFYGMTWLNFGEHSGVLENLWLMLSVLCIPAGMFAFWAMLTESFKFRSGSQLLLRNQPFILYLHSNYNQLTLTEKSDAESAVQTSLNKLLHTFNPSVLALTKQKHTEPPRNNFAWITVKDSPSSQDSVLFLIAAANAVVISTDKTPFSQWANEQALAKTNTQKLMVIPQDESDNLSSDKAQAIINFLKKDK